MLAVPSGLSDSSCLNTLKLKQLMTLNLKVTGVMPFTEETNHPGDKRCPKPPAFTPQVLFLLRMCVLMSVSVCMYRCAVPEEARILWSRELPESPAESS